MLLSFEDANMTPTYCNEAVKSYLEAKQNEEVLERVRKLS